GTEAPFTGEYTDTKTEGVYRCRACGAELFRSAAKFDSHCGWPSFYQPSEGDAGGLLEGRALGRIRTEGRCADWAPHLGHPVTGAGARARTRRPTSAGASTRCRCRWSLLTAQAETAQAESRPTAAGRPRVAPPPHGGQGGAAA